MHEYHGNFIHGGWVPSTGSEVIEVISPATEKIVGRVPDSTPADIDRAVAAARAAFDSGWWSGLTVEERCDALGGVVRKLRDRQDELARLGAEEIGMPLAMSTMAQAFFPVVLFERHLAMGRRLQTRQHVEGMMGPVLVVGEPVGVVGAIVPWNYPLVLAVNKVAAALIAGCTVVLKTAPNAPLATFVLAEAAAEAGLPPGVLNVVVADRDASERLVVHPDVDKISFTGSTAAGRRIMSLCGEQVKRVTLELGGKSACVLLDDADLDAAIPSIATQITLNSGQTCAAQTRLMVPQGQQDDVLDRLGDVLSAVRLGDPFDPATTMGPVVSAVQRDRVEDYIRSGQDQGAKVAVGGGRPAGLDRGFFIEPTVFVDVDNSMRIAQEEIFGPVLAVVAHDGDDHAIALANESPYGLSGAVWSADAERAVAVAERVRTGSFGINGAAFDLTAPFGGFKQSGIGREGGELGIRSYLEYKSVFGA